MVMIVFAGPSLAASERRELRDIEVRPPAACGDVLRGASEGPSAIGLIDGLFETRPAPWHKEILWALARGIAVFGAASMGALRAAELAPFGMRGVGAVFRAYRDGILEDDDEVAVQHGPAETDYMSLSEAMVNVRASLTSASESGVLNPAQAELIARAAKAVFYKDRIWDRIFSDAIALGVPPADVWRFAAWLPANRVDIKARDAQELLATMQGWTTAGDSGDAPPAFRDTLHFTALRRRVLADGTQA